MSCTKAIVLALSLCLLCCSLELATVVNGFPTPLLAERSVRSERIPLLSSWPAPSAPHLRPVIAKSKQRQRSSATTTTTTSTARHGLAEAYEYCLTYYNLPTVSLTSALCGGVGNFAAQLRAANQSNNNNIFRFDWKDNRIFWIKGMIGGVIWSQWYNFLDPIVTATTAAGAGAQWIAPILSTLAEQIFFCPIIFSLYEMPFPMFLRGDPVDQIPGRVQAKLGSVLLENAKVWTLANLLVYSAPLQWRVLISGIAEAFWQMLLAQQLAAEPPKRPVVDVYLPLASAAEQQQQQEAVRAFTASSSSAVDRMLEPAAAEQR